MKDLLRVCYGIQILVDTHEKAVGLNAAADSCRVSRPPDRAVNVDSAGLAVHVPCHFLRHDRGVLEIHGLQPQSGDFVPDFLLFHVFFQVQVLVFPPFPGPDFKVIQYTDKDDFFF